jgi:starch-binding outer membrane protein, SusD/RagB family
MRNMKNIITYTLIIAFFGSGSACTNLDENLPGNFTQKFTPSNPGVGIKNNVNKSQPNDGLQGAFSQLLNGTATNGGFFAVQEAGTDEAVITQKGGDWFDGGQYIRMHQHQFSTQTWAINDAWTQSYGGVFQCNTLLAESTITSAQAAQLKVLRAYFYWRLMDVFGNIKLVTKPDIDVAQSVPTSGDPYAGRRAAYNFIESELLAAIPILPSGKQEYGRVNQGAAHALLARLYLNANIYTGTPQYQKAIDAADAVINSGLYSLSPNYADVFSPTNVENVEHIFVVPFDEATGQGATWSQETLHYPSQLTYQLQEQPWNGFSSLEDFYNSYEPTDKRKAANFIVGPQFDTNGNPVLDLAYDKADPDGPPVNYTPAINELFPNASRQAGARFGKFSFKIGQSRNADNDFPLLRFGEVLLNKAEALQRLNNNFSDPAALSLVNQIRARAGLTTPLGSMTEADMLAERGRELFVEALRRTDMIRFGAYFGSWWSNPGDPDPVNHAIMAIPLQQMNASATATFPLKQNPGY